VWCRFANVSEAHAASIIKVEDGESVSVVVDDSGDEMMMMMIGRMMLMIVEAAGFSESLVYLSYYTVWCTCPITQFHITDDIKIHGLNKTALT
jgi:hypothetical protein